MAAYTATFSQGETKSIANSTREYRAAWLIEMRDTTGELPNSVRMGFARDHGTAKGAAQREFSGLNSVSRWQRGRIPANRWNLVRVEVVGVEAA